VGAVELAVLLGRAEDEATVATELFAEFEAAVVELDERDVFLAGDRADDLGAAVEAGGDLVENWRRTREVTRTGLAPAARVSST
jgi:hypothetical protein